MENNHNEVIKKQAEMLSKLRNIVSTYENAIFELSKQCKLFEISVQSMKDERVKLIQEIEELKAIKLS